MNAMVRELGGQVAMLVTLMGSLTPVEMLLPLHPRPSIPGRVRKNLILIWLTFSVAWCSSLLATAFLDRSDARGLFNLERPSIGEVLIAIAVLDFFTYVAHVAMHRVPVLWRFHRVHHADPFVDVTTSLRFHPMEALWRQLWTFAPALLLGLPLQAIIIYRVISATNGVFEHANLRVARRLDRTLSRVWVTPNMHKVHHSCVRAETDSNYGNILALFDRLFGTFTPTERAFDVTYGLKAHKAQEP